jgi:Flp pilus assembly protein TadD
VKTDLRELEEQALALMNRGEKAKATELFKAIIRKRPDWENGEAFYDVAGCQEDLGELDKASENYRRALEYEPRNPYFLGGYASFLYLHGDPRSAFEQHLRLWEIERNNEDSSAKMTWLRVRYRCRLPNQLLECPRRQTFDQHATDFLSFVL